MLHFEGDKNFPHACAQLWTKLSDARFLLLCIPDVKSVLQAEPRMAVCTLRPGFSFVGGTLEVTLQIMDVVEATSFRVVVHSKGIGSTSDVEATIALETHSGGTHVHWVADVKRLGGLLKAVPQGLIKASAQKVIADVWAALEAKIASMDASDQ